MSSLRSELRDSSVHDKISQFNTLAMQQGSKSLERKAADAALKRAMLGREEAESEVRRYREENKIMRVQLEKSKDREQRVSERLETVMVRRRPHRLSPTASPLTWTLPSLGAIRQSQGDLCPHQGRLGNGDPAGTQQVIQQ